MLGQQDNDISSSISGGGGKQTNCGGGGKQTSLSLKVNEVVVIEDTPSFDEGTEDSKKIVDIEDDDNKRSNADMNMDLQRELRFALLTNV